MVKKIAISLLLISSSIGMQLEASIAATVAETLKSYFGEKRSPAREMAEQLTLVFTKGGYETEDGSFDACKGAITARDGFAKGAMEEMFSEAVFSFLKSHYETLLASKKIGKDYAALIQKKIEAIAEAKGLDSVTEDVITKLTDADKLQLYKSFYKKFGKVFSKIGLDFALQGVTYINGDIENKSFKHYMNSKFLPRFAKKMVVYWTVFGSKLGTSYMLSTYKMGDIMNLYSASQMIPFIGIILEDLPEAVIESIYERAVAQAKKMHEKMSTKNNEDRAQAIAA